MSDSYRFYASEVSYFSAKVRPFFRYKNIPYQELEPTPEVYRDIIRPRTGLAFIPVVITPDDVALQDTSMILDELERRFPQPPVYPTTPVQQVLAYIFEVFADEFMILPAMHYRWNFAESEAKARADFAKASGNPETAGKFADRMKGSIQMLGVQEATIPAIESFLRDFVVAFSVHLERQNYLFGNRMSLGDLALMGPLYAHLSLDAVPARLMRESAPQVGAWIERMNQPQPRGGEFLSDDAVAPTLRPILELVGRDAGPYVLDNIQAFESWADTRSADITEPPRGVGMHPTTLRGIEYHRYTSPYTSWMLQRVIDAYDRLASADRLAVDTALHGTGLEAWLAWRPRHRMIKQHFKLAFA